MTRLLASQRMRAQRPDGGRQRHFVSIAVGAALFAAGFALGGIAGVRPTEAASSIEVASAHASERGPTKVACADIPKRAVATAPTAAPVDRPQLERDPARVQAQRTQQADELVDGLIARINMMGGGDPNRDPEAIAAGVAMYQHGFVDALKRTVPELAPELGDRIEETMCDPAAKPGHLISLAQVVDKMPELARERALDCIVDRGREDSVLWATLDAWSGAGIPNAHALSTLKATARDERTLRRLASGNATPSPSSDAEE